MWLEYAGTAAVLVVSLVAYVRASAALTAARRVSEDAGRDASRSANAVREDLEQQIEVLKRQLTKVAAGEELNQDMIEDGQLWKDVDGSEAASVVGDTPAHDTRGSAFVLDVRTPAETAAGIVEGAVLIPMDEIEARRAELPTDGRPVLVYCAAGGRSAAVCDFLSKEGFENMHNLLGGFGAWPGSTATPSDA